MSSVITLASSRIDEVNHVSTALGLNGYPVAFVCHHSSKSTLQRPLPPRWRSTIVLPYVRGLSEKDFSQYGDTSFF